VFASPSEKYTLPANAGPELAPLASRTFDRFSLAIGGTAKVKVPILGEVPLLKAYGLYEYPDYFEFGGGFEFGIGFLSLKGGVNGLLVRLRPLRREVEVRTRRCGTGRGSVRDARARAPGGDDQAGRPGRSAAGDGHRPERQRNLQEPRRDGRGRKPNRTPR
jgi:hypothetical protein